MTQADTIAVHVLTSVDEVSEAHWNALAGSDNPFTQHGFFKAVEASRSACAQTGWMAAHFCIMDEAETPIALMPAYIKSHSQGEYVFDHSWADAYHRAGGEYYPKLQASVPFTPATGPRLLTPDPSLKVALLNGAQSFAQQKNISSLHLTFLNEADRAACAAAGMAMRTDQQFHWKNDGYETFDDFLGALSSRKRKNIRKERKQALCAGLTVEQIKGADITQAHWDAYYAFYLDTGARKWGRPYINAECFNLFSELLGDQVMLIMAKRGDTYVAGALNFIGQDTLYGRYWGALEHHPCLHFEICYYQAIDYAIAHGLKTVEAGAQGEHKLARGYVPTPTYSAHWMGNTGFQSAVEDYLRRERAAVERDIEFLSTMTPFKVLG